MGKKFKVGDVVTWRYKLGTKRGVLGSVKGTIDSIDEKRLWMLIKIVFPDKSHSRISAKRKNGRWFVYRPSKDYLEPLHHSKGKA